MYITWRFLDTPYRLPADVPCATAVAWPLLREMTGIENIQMIGDEVAIRWKDDFEAFLKMDRLRALSPSAETQGERDLLGQQISGDQKGTDFTGVTVTGWIPVGGYGIQFHFSDGHRTGIYTFDYLREIAENMN